MQSAGATFRLVVDVGEWNSSLAMNAPGQSGPPRRPAPDRPVRPVGTRRSLPLLYSRERIDAEAETVIELNPPA
ncbi:penicillin acylase family protein [Amycolatopsis sp. NPDC023774]|uniref:penicillin acylase family protein n=1 Tax=Amycolatopsis sp. NPDC023774 TaxID=3155015 RepID=UPI0033EF59A3